jgi:rubrerythrin
MAMIQYLNEDEVYRVGMCIEEAGLEFYTKMARKAEDQATKRIFNRLAKDEKQHLAFFESLEVKTAGGLGARPAETDKDVSQYVCSLVDGGIFSSLEKMDKLAARKFNPEKALELALQVEKDAVLYYTEAYAASRKRSTKEALRRLIDEEKGHVVQITKRLSALRKRAESGR